MTRVAAELEVGESGRSRASHRNQQHQPTTSGNGRHSRHRNSPLGTAPLGDPLEFELRGYRLSLRRPSLNRSNSTPTENSIFDRIAESRRD